MHRQASNYVGRNQSGGTEHHQPDHKGDDRKAHHLTDIEFRDRKQGQQPERLDHVRDTFADRDRHGDQTEIGRRTLTERQRRVDRDRALHSPVSAAGRHEQADDQRADEGQERQRVLRRAANDRMGQQRLQRLGLDGRLLRQITQQANQTAV